MSVLLYRPVFGQIYKTADVSTKTIMADQTTIKYASELVKGSTADSLHTTTITSYFEDGTHQKVTAKQKITASGEKSPAVVTKEIVLGEVSRLNTIAYVTLMVLFVAMVYGPIAAFLVELFPTRIRYTSMSLPYHIGNGVFGGLVPFIATLITTLPGTNYLSGLWYPIIVAALCFVIGSLYLSNKSNTPVDE